MTRRTASNIAKLPKLSGPLAWLFSIHEGEGSCGITLAGGSAWRQSLTERSKVIGRKFHVERAEGLGRAFPT